MKKGDRIKIYSKQEYDHGMFREFAWTSATAKTVERYGTVLATSRTKRTVTVRFDGKETRATLGDHVVFPL